MAQEILNAGSVDQTNAVWTDSANIIGQYNATKNPAYVEQDGSGDYYGDMLLENTANTPTAINHFKIIYWDSAAAQNNDDFLLRFYNNPTGWVSFINAPLEVAETEYIDDITENFLTAIQTQFAAAEDKAAWVNAFAVRYHIDVVKGADGIIISTFGMEMEIEYTPAAGFIRSHGYIIG